MVSRLSVRKFLASRMSVLLNFSIVVREHKATPSCISSERLSLMGRHATTRIVLDMLMLGWISTLLVLDMMDARFPTKIVRVM